MVYLTKSVSKFTPKKFEIDPWANTLAYYCKYNNDL